MFILFSTDQSQEDMLKYEALFNFFAFIFKGVYSVYVCV